MSGRRKQANEPKLRSRKEISETLRRVSGDLAALYEDNSELIDLRLASDIALALAHAIDRKPHSRDIGRDIGGEGREVVCVRFVGALDALAAGWWGQTKWWLSAVDRARMMDASHREFATDRNWPGAQAAE